MNMAHYVYKYVVDGKIIYIGKNDTNLINRINQHKTEDKFKPFLDKARIYYIEVDDGYMSEALETFLIKKYSPELNISKISKTGFSINFDEPVWLPYSSILPKEKEMKPTTAAATPKTNTKSKKPTKEELKLIEEEKYIEYFKKLYDLAKEGKEEFTMSLGNLDLHKNDILPNSPFAWMSFTCSGNWTAESPKRQHIYTKDNVYHHIWKNEQKISFSGMTTLEVFKYCAEHGHANVELSNELWEEYRKKDELLSNAVSMRFN